MVRAPCCEKVGLKKGRWTEEEDEILAKYIKANGEGQWRSLPKNAGLLRCGKSCRLRWINYLRADLKRGNISAEEENTIVKLHASFGNRWSLIASHLPGRTDNEIKNYWNSHLSRKIYSFTKQAGEGGFTSIPVPSPKGKGGRKSRWAMNKNKTHTQQNANTPKQNSDNDIIGLCQLESINEGSGELGGISEMLLESCGVWDIISEERERESNIGESCSSDSIALGLDQQHWDWESVIEFNNVAESKADETDPSPNWENQQNLLTWLWEDDDSQTDHGNKLVETDPQIQNDIVQWILS